ncbi:MAG: branched-chain amino acid ABC transporter permease [Lautropia sp.]
MSLPSASPRRGALRALWLEAPPRSRLALLLFTVALIALPAIANRHVLSVMVVVLSLAYLGQAWNIMMGFCGQLSLGHALYIGLGAYTSAALYQNLDLNPWLGIVAAIAVCVAAASAIGWLAFRFGISGTYFALLTIAFAEFARIGFDHFGWVGGSGGLFLRVVDADSADWAELRGGPLMFYFLSLALTLIAFALSAWLLRSRTGYYFRAIRDNEDAARAAGVDTFRYKMIAVQISGGMSALGGVLYAFFYSNLFPEQIFNIGRSIEVILAPIIGGIGTLFGPVLGAMILTALSESITQALDALGYDIPGVKQILYGFALGATILFLPHGVWPSIARSLGLTRQRPARADPGPPGAGGE